MRLQQEIHIQGILTITVEGTNYRTSSTYREVVVYTDQGTPVSALQMVSSYVGQVNSDGTTSQVDNLPIDASQNCHGTTFADGKLMIVDGSDNNESVQTILREDGYVSEGVTIENADAFVMEFAGVDLPFRENQQWWYDNIWSWFRRALNNYIGKRKECKINSRGYKYDFI